jgi:hypothetical protein|tara:strand:+ start:669 stop:1628 length:960 start_codon:yes stop_codon:yes gene_type:complete
MIYLIIIIIITLYFFLFFENIGENTKISFRNNKLIMVILFFLLIIGGYFFNNSGIINQKEYSSILNQHYEIRKNISTIKKNIPILLVKLQDEPDYYKGWVMLAKSYIITDQLMESSIAYERALSLEATDPVILEEFISVLIKINPKSNKEKILKYFNELVLFNEDDLNVYNMMLNYSIDINDAELTKSILSDIVSNPEIKDKDQYQSALNQMDKSDIFDLRVNITQENYSSLIKHNYIFFILKEDGSKFPFAVVKFSNNALPKIFSINSSNKMISDSMIPKSVRLYIKGSNQPSVNNNMYDIYKSDIIDLSKSEEYIIN